MIYPTYGVITETGEETRLLHALCQKIYVHGAVSSRFYINGKTQTICYKIPLTVPILSVDEFIQTYTKFYSKLITWVESLQVGDTVVIEQPRMDDIGAYPYSFVFDMKRYVGHELKIKSIHEVPAYGYLENGTRLQFTLEEAPGYAWHSSMFELPDNLNVNKLTLTDLIINPFEL